eukprot:scaffold372982_cov29-Prasinocladus_malaysianus.AAC.1
MKSRRDCSFALDEIALVGAEATASVISDEVSPVTAAERRGSDCAASSGTPKRRGRPPKAQAAPGHTRKASAEPAGEARRLLAADQQEGFGVMICTFILIRVLDCTSIRTHACNHHMALKLCMRWRITVTGRLARNVKDFGPEKPKTRNSALSLPARIYLFANEIA